MNGIGVLVIGSSNMDLVVTTKRFPQPGETILGKKFSMFPGGKGANQAVACAKLGSDTFFISKLGDDDFKNRLVKNMKENGLNPAYLLIDKDESTGTALITVDEKGQNEIIVISGSNMKLMPKDVELNTKLFTEVNIVLTQLEIPIETVVESAKLAKKNKATFILNPAPAHELPEKLWELIDYLTPNENELELLSGIKINDKKSIEKAAKKLIEKGVKNIIVTLGEQGALLVTNDHTDFFPTRKVKVVDTTAAGDAFNGALANALSNEVELNKAIDYANKVASISVTRMGAQSSMPDLNEINDLYFEFNNSTKQEIK